MATPLDADEAVLDRAAQARAARFGVAPHDPLNLVWALEFLDAFLPGWRFKIVNQMRLSADRGGPAYFGAREAKGGYLPARRELWLTDDVYMALAEGDPWAREVAAHELGHAVLEHPTTSYDFGDPRHRLYRADEAGAEREAAMAADELLLPRSAAHLDCAEGVEARFGVGRGLALRQRSRARRG